MMKICEGSICCLFIGLVFFSACHPTENSDDRRDEFEILALTKISDLKEQKLSESSGLIKINGELWTHNDSGGQTYLYQIDKASGEVSDDVRIIKATNRDWEALTQDEQHIYIGDFGNNLGDRKDLKVYKISRDSLLSKKLVEAQVINFSYPDQTEYTGNYDHDFDCEALISVGDSLYLFSKNWKSKKCSIYALPKSPGSYSANKKATFNTKGVITDATYQEASQKLVLVGYNLKLASNEFFPFVWTFSGFENSDFFAGSSKRHNLDAVRQVEAVTIDSNNTYWLTAENEQGGPATLFKVTIPQ